MRPEVAPSLPVQSENLLQNSELTNFQLDAGLDPSASKVHFLAHESSWFLAVRGMGLLQSQAQSHGWHMQAEGEVTSCLLLGAEGFLRRLISVGIAYSRLNDSRILAGSLVYRIFAPTLSEPEIRFRVGKNLDTDAVVVGLIAGTRYPFGSGHGPHFAGYLEAGSLLSLETERTLRYWGAAGLGFHF